MTKQEMMKIVYNQLAIDYNCSYIKVKFVLDEF